MDLSHPSSYVCCRWRARAPLLPHMLPHCLCAYLYLALLSMTSAREHSRTNLYFCDQFGPVACFASAMYSVLFFRGPAVL